MALAAGAAAVAASYGANSYAISNHLRAAILLTAILFGTYTLLIEYLHVRKNDKNWTKSWGVRLFLSGVVALTVLDLGTVLFAVLT